MNLPKYRYRTNENHLDYEFISTGPKGKIKKVVRFVKLNESLYNLGFGDLDEESGEISDSIITDNKDSLKVLATVASTLSNFYEWYHHAQVLIIGSTASRTRLYQMGITKNWSEISLAFEVQGFVNGKWENFTPIKNYEAFIVRRKKS